ncbi:MAG TPA: hypothetical protein VI603_03575, partial [Saprospiraceae bacterium]|nr:hypothetical protein [Saprospiraceae bacterium]
MKYVLDWAYLLTLTITLITDYPLSLYAQDLNLSFHHLSQNDGLTQGTNSYVMQDSRGFIWISSVSGLNRYDGKRIVTYQPKVHDSTSLASGVINSKIFEDDKGDLWFTSNVAIQRYIRAQDCFETIRISDAQGNQIKEDVMAFDLDNQGNLWLRVGVRDTGRLHVFNTISRKDSIYYQLD